MIKEGKVVAFPTETVYGLGADAFNPAAVARIFEIKERPSFDPLIVHIADHSMLVRLVDEPDEEMFDLVQKYWPGPLTLVMKKSAEVPDIVTAGLPTVAIRMPNHSVALELIRESGTALAAPSANPFGSLSPTSAKHVEKQLGDRVTLILDGGNCEVGLESTIISRGDAGWNILRPGGISRDDLEEIIGPLKKVESPGERPEAPGQLPWHYSPSSTLTVVPRITDPMKSDKKAGCLFFEKPDGDLHERHGFLSHDGNLNEAAANLFSELHRLDDLGLEQIYVEEVPEHGAGLAIMDRLRRAAARREQQVSSH